MKLQGQVDLPSESCLSRALIIHHTCFLNFSNFVTFSCDYIRWCFFQIIYDINFNFMEELKKRIGLDFSRLSQMSIVEEGAVKVFKMAYHKIAFI